MRRLLVACLLLGACGTGTHKAPTEVRALAVGTPSTAVTSRAPIVTAPDDGMSVTYAAPEPPTTTTTVPEPTTTTTTEPPRPPVTAASRSRGGSTVQSTAYCLTGHMANGQPTHVGAVAGNQWPLGTVLEVSDSPYGPGRFTVEDRIGWGSELDFATPADCGLANQWGRRSITVEVVG